MSEGGHAADALWRPPPTAFTLGPCIGGRPGITRVFAAHDPAGHPCVLKTLHPTAAARAVQLARFHHEIAAHLAASEAPHVAKASAPDDRGAWLAIAWAHGGDMARGVEHSSLVRGRVAQRADRYAETLLEALVVLHEHGVIHRDIKPSNLLLDGEQVWLSDFGIAALRPDGTSSWRALPEPFEERSAGTPPWAAPELADTPPACTPGTDIFGVGMVWQWMLALRDEPAGESREHAADQTLHVFLRARMLSRVPHERPTAGEALALLRATTRETSGATHRRS